MSARDLTAKYGGNIAQAISRAVRAELLAGPEVLDALDAAHKSAVATRSPHAEAALDLLRQAAQIMRAEIRSRYDMPPAE